MAMVAASYVGAAHPRVDGPLKVSGQARYAAEFGGGDRLFGVVVSSAVAKGRIARLDASQALATPGVVAVYSHEHRPRGASRAALYRDQVAPPGEPFRPLHDERILFGGQPVALVVAKYFETARHAATLVKIDYDAEPPQTELSARLDDAYVPPRKRPGIAPPAAPRGDARSAFDAAPVRIAGRYVQPAEFHNPIEPHAATAILEPDGRLTVHDKTQGAQNTQAYVAQAFGLPADKVRVISPFVGGAFGLALRPQPQLFLAVMACLDLERAVTVSLTRDQMFTLGYRPQTIQSVSLGCGTDGRLCSVIHDAVAATSRSEDYQENVVNWSGLLYECPNALMTYRLAKLDAATPCDMRAPGAATGLFALESAMDELAHAARLDPLELRLRNYAERDLNEDRPYTSKALRQCYDEGAKAFGWSRRGFEPRSMREGRELIGFGMATGVWEALMQPTTARARVGADGRLEVATATADVGTGSYTILSQIGADALGLPIEQVTALVGDSSLPKSPVEGGSWAAASAGAAVRLACWNLRGQLLQAARGVAASPLANASIAHVVFAEGCVILASDPSRRVSFSDAIHSLGLDALEAEETARRAPGVDKAFSANTHSAVFVEVRVDEELGVVRVTRVVSAVAAGLILNPLTARSQIVGGVTMGIGMALHEEGLVDAALGRVMNHNFGEYHLPSHADVGDVEVIFVAEEDDKVSPMGVKGVGEIGIVGVAAAVANAVFHATGRRVRELPITLDRLL
ncbi:xanthine dehydrogenase family protein molybdopterin-binding subunit [Methylocella sp.]|uniref:xanthine dehydrogenase family protein molybdopterin-binding subunit n=1 Tax=Methylocella sp. TaxID=1978226 RepID=UPI003783AA57